MAKLDYNCKVMLRITNGAGIECRIITYIRNHYHIYDLYDYVEFIDVSGLTRTQTRKMRETFGITEPLQSNLIDIRFQIVRILSLIHI